MDEATPAPSAAAARAAREGFSRLTPDVVLDAVEQALGRRCGNVCRPLASYINRVYEVAMADATFVVAKFYRPGRWSRAALEDELEFVRELAAEELPVVPPVAGADGGLLHERDGAPFAVYPKKGGRVRDEFEGGEWAQLGRLLARVHAVGERRAPRDRPRLEPGRSFEDHIGYLLEHGGIPPEHLRPFERAARGVQELIAPLFADAEAIRVHGDCHRGNLLHRPGEGFVLIDFDDFAVGPPVQDLWMLLPGPVRECVAPLGRLLEGYETFRPFARGALRLIEPLRAMRFLHYAAWCARQKADGGFARLSPGWGAPAYWRQEIHDLDRQRREILDALDAPLPPV